MEVWVGTPMATTELTWDNTTGDWSTNHWNPGLQPGPNDVMTKGIVHGGAVTVDADRIAYSLEQDGGAVIVGQNNTLTLPRGIESTAGTVSLLDGSRLISQYAGGTIANLSVTGTAVLDVRTGTVAVANLTMASYLHKPGAGTLTLQNVTAPDSTIEVSGGTLSAPDLGGADVVLNGGTFAITPVPANSSVYMGLTNVSVQASSTINSLTTGTVALGRLGFDAPSTLTVTGSGGPVAFVDTTVRTTPAATVAINTAVRTLGGGLDANDLGVTFAKQGASDLVFTHSGTGLTGTTIDVQAGNLALIGGNTATGATVRLSGGNVTLGSYDGSNQTFNTTFTSTANGTITAGSAGGYGATTGDISIATLTPGATGTVTLAAQDSHRIVLPSGVTAPTGNLAITQGEVVVQNSINVNSLAGGDSTITTDRDLTISGTSAVSYSGRINVTSGNLIINTGAGTAMPSGLQAWYDASTLALSDGATVTAWADMSGNGRNLISWTGTPTFAANQSNGQPAVRFDASDENLQMATSNPYFAKDVYMVFRSGNGANFGPNWGAPFGVKDGPDADRMWMFRPNDQNFWDQEKPEAVTRNGVVIPDVNHFDMNTDMGQYMVLKVQANEGVGVTQPSATGNGSQPRDYIVGTRTDGWADSRWDTAEILAFNHTLSAAEENAVGGYLASKYGISASYTGSIYAALGDIVMAPGTSVAITGAGTPSVNSVSVVGGPGVSGQADISGPRTFLANAAGDTLTFNSTATTAADFSVTGPGTVIMNGTLSTSGSLSLGAGATLALTGDTTVGGGLTVTAGGTIASQDDLVLDASSGRVTVLGTLDVADGTTLTVNTPAFLAPTANTLMGSIFRATPDNENPVNLDGAAFQQSVTRVLTGTKAGTILALAEDAALNVTVTGTTTGWAAWPTFDGSIDHFVTAYSGMFTPAETGIHNFNWNNDDRGLMYIDLNQDGVFLSTERVAPYAWNSTGNVNLTAGMSYDVIYMAQEFGGGQGVNWYFSTPSVSNRLVNPGDAAQAGMWSTGIPSALLGDLVLGNNSQVILGGTATARFNSITTTGAAATIQGNPILNGAMTLGNSPGTLTVTGNFTMGAGSAYHWETDGTPAGTDLVDATGYSITFGGAWDLGVSLAGALPAGLTSPIQLMAGNASAGFGTPAIVPENSYAHLIKTGTSTVSANGSGVYVTLDIMANSVWTSSTDNVGDTINWVDPQNWLGATLPTAATAAIVQAPALTNPQVATIGFGETGDAQLLIIDHGGHVRVNAGGTLEVGAGGIHVDNTGTLTLGQGPTLTAAAPNTLNVLPGGTLAGPTWGYQATLPSDTTVRLAGGTMTGNFILTNPSTTADSYALEVESGLSTAKVIGPAASLRKSKTGAATFSGGVNLDTIKVEEGSLTFGYGPGLTANTVTVTGGTLQSNKNATIGTLQLDGGTTTLTRHTTVTDTLKGSATLIADGSFEIDLSAATVNLGGTLRVANSVPATSGNLTLNMPAPGIPAPSGAGAIYTFDNTSGVTVYNDGSTGSTYDGTLFNGAALTASGKVGEGMTIADNTLQHLRLPSSGLPLGTEWSIGTWFYNLHDDTSDWRTLARTNNGHHIVIVGNANDNLGTHDGGWADSGYDLYPSDGWHHLVATSSAAGTLFYIDGSYVGSTGQTSTGNIEGIGNSQSQNQSFAQVIDEFYVYNRVLTAAEALQLYQSSGLGGSWLGHLQLDPSTQVTLTGSGEANIGTIGATGGLTIGSTLKVEPTASGPANIRGTATGVILNAEVTTSNFNVTGGPGTVSLGTDAVLNIASGGSLAVPAGVTLSADPGTGGNATVNATAATINFQGGLEVASGRLALNLPSGTPRMGDLSMVPGTQLVSSAPVGFSTARLGDGATLTGDIRVDDRITVNGTSSGTANFIDPDGLRGTARGLRISDDLVYEWSFNKGASEHDLITLAGDLHFDGSFTLSIFGEGGTIMPTDYVPIFLYSGILEVGDQEVTGLDLLDYAIIVGNAADPNHLYIWDTTNAALSILYLGEPDQGIYLTGLFAQNIPEPCTLTVLALGGLALLRRRRRKS